MSDELKQLAKVLGELIQRQPFGARMVLFEEAKALGEAPGPDEVRALIDKWLTDEDRVKLARAEAKRLRRKRNRADKLFKAQLSTGL